MSFKDLLKIEFTKIKRGKILFILIIPILLLWIPAIVNAMGNLRITNGLTVEQNFLFQSLSSYTWFLLPATIVICTVMIEQIEEKNKGLLKMLSLPINISKICLAKFVVLITLIFIQIFTAFLTYFVSVGISYKLYDYNFLLSISEVIKVFTLIFITAIPMATIYWLLAIIIKTPIFSVGIGMASIVPSVFMINVSCWYIYPMDYPFMMIGSMLPNLNYSLIPWIPIALGISIICLGISCIRFGAVERR